MNAKMLSFSLLAAAGFGFAADAVNVQVLSATIRNKTIPGAQVLLQKQGQTTLTATTGADGSVSLPSTFGADDSSVTLIVKKDMFSTLVAKCPCKGMTYAISENMVELDGMRAVLSWGAEPRDLDLHLAYPESHIYFANQKGTQADLDVDDTTSYGPETITIRKRKAGDKYVFAVHNYTDREKSASDRLTKVSQAKVFVYIGSSLVRTFVAPTTGTGNVWLVFGIDEQGNFHDINKLTSASNPDNLGGLMKGIYGNAFDTAAIVAAASVESSKSLNKQGEDAYHAGDLAGSIEFYRQAIDADPTNGQAYSNLGLAYQKSDRVAEAIWASRKAIELAHGTTAPTVRAGSFYNIARMYEAKSQWQDALDNYQQALSNKQNKAYTDGIARMKAKLGQ